MSLDAARAVLFVRALSRVTTNHESVLPHTNARWTSVVRLVGEFVALLALAYLAEHNGSERPYEILLGIFFAFFLPNLLLHDAALRKARHILVGGDMAKTVGSHVLVGSLGVFLCYATYEGFVKLMDDWRIHNA